MSVDVDVGITYVFSSRVASSATTLTVPAADANNPRKDGVDLDQDDNLIYAEGTPAPHSNAVAVAKGTISHSSREVAQ